MIAVGRNPHDDAGSLRLSVVIPTHDRPERLERCLAALDGQTLPRKRFEVIVADDASRADPSPIAARHGARLIRLPSRRGPAAARNTGWRASRGEAVLFLDDDVEPAPDLLAAAVDALAAAGPRVAAVEGQVEPEDAAAAESPFAHTLRTRGGGHTCNIAYWRSALEAAGGFDEGFPDAVGEDYDLAYRVMQRVGPIAYEPRMQALHAVHGQRSLRAAWRVRTRNRPSLMRLFLKHPDRFPPRFLPDPLWRAWSKVAGRPTLAAVVGYLLLHNAVSVVARRDLLVSAPSTWTKWALFLAVDSARIVGEVPSLRRHHRRIARELGQGSSSAAP